MPPVNMLEAKTTLSKLVEAVESGAEAEIIIARNGKPAARLVPIKAPKNRIRLGLAEGRYVIGSLDPELDADVARLFGIED
jgi:prevent-host-death family protein